MTAEIDETHNPALGTWIPSADGHPDFPIQNLPLGVFRRRAGGPAAVGVAIGDQVLDLTGCREKGLIAGPAAELVRSGSLGPLLAAGETPRRELRRTASSLLRAGVAGCVPEPLLPAQSTVVLELPAAIGDYTDFYASIHHATRVGALLRPDNPLFPNYKWVPIAYHGRASSIVPSGTPIRRPHGQTAAEGAAPAFGPSRRLDYEMEVGFFIGPGNGHGQAVPIAEAGGQIAGLCLVNDWSARDIQRWEYQPLGPFLSKSFATTISPWIVTAEALAPFRAPLRPRAPGDPEPLDYLADPNDRAAGGFDVQVEVLLSTEAMRAAGLAPHPLSRGSLLDLYWTPAQMIAHHTSNGCPLRPGDLLASGTVSGPSPESAGCLLERTEGGRSPLALPNGEKRAFLEDGDDVTMRAWCERPGYARIGFGVCGGRILP